MTTLRGSVFGVSLVAITALVTADILPSFAQDGDLLKELNANFEKGVNLSKQGKHAEAIPYMTKAAKLAPKVYGAGDLNTAVVLYSTGSVYRAAGKYRDAEPLYRSCLEIQVAKLPKDDLQLAATLFHLGFL